MDGPPLGAGGAISSDSRPFASQIALEVITVGLAPRHPEAICPLVPIEASGRVARDRGDVTVEVNPGLLECGGVARVVRVQHDRDMRVRYVLLLSWPGVAARLDHLPQRKDKVILLRVRRNYLA